MTTPVRLQLSRRKGFNIQEASRAINGLPAINVARPSIWGNPFVVGGTYLTPKGATALVKDREHAVLLHSAMITALASVPGGRCQERLSHLRGHNLACWCKPGEGPCHADVLLEIANK